MNKLLANKKTIFLFMLPASVMFLGVIILPIMMSVNFSLTEWDGMSPAKFIGLDNYIRLFTDAGEGFLAAARNSFVYALCAIFIQLPIALLFALILASGVKGEKIYITIFFVPVLISTVVTGQLWMRIFDMQHGVLNLFLSTIGLEKLAHPWLADPKTALPCVFVALVWQFIGYYMLLMYASIKTISPEIAEAAKIDGAGFWQTSFKITIPLIKPMIRVCLILAVVGALKMFDLVYIMTNGGPAHATEVPSTLMVTAIFRRNLYGYGSSMAVFIIAECFLFAFLIRKFVKTEEDAV